MLRDLASQKKVNQQLVLDAIESLKGKGWDINPYTVADEAKIPRSALYRDPELMELITGEKVTVADDSNVTEQVSELNQRNEELQNQITQLQTEIDLLTREKQQAWQLGYHAAIADSQNHAAATTGSDSRQADADSDNQPDDFPNLQATVDASEQLQAALEAEPEESAPPIEEFLDAIGHEFEAEAIEQSVFEESEESVVADDEVKVVSEDALRDLLQHRMENQQAAAKGSESPKKASGNKFVGSNRTGQDLPPQSFVMRSVPPDIRKACLILGLRPEGLTREAVHKAWKKEITNPGGHPDIGGETEIAIYLNTAKDELYTFLDAQEPKLGKKFGAKEAKAGES